MVAILRPAWVTALAGLLLLSYLPLPSSEAASAERAGDLPYAVVGASAAYVDGSTYVIGGRMADGVYSHDILRYDHRTQQVTDIGDLPQVVGSKTGGRQSGAAVALNGKVYYFGGAAIVEADINGDGTPEAVPRSIPDIVEFDPSTGQAIALLDKLPAGAWGVTSAVSGNKAYLFGGFSFDISNPSEIKRRDWILRFDPSAPAGTRVATESATLPFPVQDAAAALVGNRIYVLGGLGEHDAVMNPCPKNRRYNSDTGQYEEAQITVCATDAISSFDPVGGVVRDYDQRLPQKLQFINAGAYRGKAYIPGGRLSDGAASTTILEFNPSATPALKPLAPLLPEGVFGAPVTFDADGNLFLFGGRLGGITDLTDNIVRITPRPTLPQPPRSLATSAISGGVRLDWVEPAYDGDSPVTVYRVYRTTPGGAEERIAETSSLFHEDRTARPGTEYAYRVTSVNAIGESAVGATTQRSTEATVPGPVLDFQAYGGNAQVLLRWVPPTDTGGANITGYRVLRDGALLTTLPPGAREFLDQPLTNDRSYSYVVRAFNVKGDGAPSPARAAAPAPVPGAPSDLRLEKAAAQVTLRWQGPLDPVDSYTIYRGESEGKLGVHAQGVQGTVYEDLSVVPGKTYYYAVVAVNDVGSSPPSEVARASLVTRTSAPLDLFATPLEGAIRLTWKPPSDTGKAPVESLLYYLSRKPASSATWSILDVGNDGYVRGTFYNDTRVQPGVEYEYQVTAVNPNFESSDPSNIARGTPKVVVNRIPVARLSAEAQQVDADAPVRLDASGSFDSDGKVVSYKFDFDDGSPKQNSSNPQAVHQYTQQGNFVVKLIVYDDRGAASEVVSLVVTVGTPPERVDTGADNRLSNKTTRTQPGANTKGLPDVGLVGVALALGLVAVAMRRGLRP